MTTATQILSIPATLTGRERFLAAANNQLLDRPPVWMMRQAGRVLPEYRELKSRYSFVQLVQTPDLAAEVTLQPIRRFGFDAAILFSDILVIPEAMGQPYFFRETGGVEMSVKLESAADIARLSVEAIEEKLQYVVEALTRIKPALHNQTALIGFAGSPWTLATFMLEGGSSKSFQRAAQLSRSDPHLFHELLQKLTIATTRYLQMQISAGVDAVQIFDSHGDHLLPTEFYELSGRWMREIIEGLRKQVPVILFSKGTRDWAGIAATGAQVIGVDHGISLAEASTKLPTHFAVQGNLEPRHLVQSTPIEAYEATNTIIQSIRGQRGHIFNLGHGVPPTSKLENIAAVLAAVRNEPLSTTGVPRGVRPLPPPRPMNVNLDLVRKYNVPGPRYTSYPPATHFKNETTQAEVLLSIEKNNETTRPLSLYYHLPFCQSLCWFCGCTTVITTQQNKSQSYLDYIEREMDLMLPRLNPARQVTQLHLGGGTPTFLMPDELRRLGRMIRDRFTVAPDAEAGVEIDPRRIGRDHIQALRDMGCNRASLGVQDNDPKVQVAVHRVQPREQTEQTVRWIRECGFVSLSIDLIYGLPLQTVESFNRTLDDILGLNPDRLAVFSYAHVPWLKPAQKIFTAEQLPSAELKLDLLKLTIEKLTAAGYVYIGMDHFARADDELAVAQREKTLQRNFQGYSTRGDADIYAFGMSSISQTPDFYWQNIKDLEPYYASIDAGNSPITRGYRMTDEDKLRRQTIMRLMCDLELDFPEMSRRTGVDFSTYFAPELASMHDLEADGLIERSATRLQVTELGRLLIRNIAMRFDATLLPAREGRYSRTI